MARYFGFLGRRVEVQYRAGDIVLPASGTLVADSGRSIFLEQNFEQHGRHKHFRWEIPYQCVVRLGEKPHPGAQVNAAASPLASVATPQVPTETRTAEEPRRASAAASAAAPPGRVPLSHRPKTA